MAFKDFREWLNLLDSIGELRRVKCEVNWDREIGALTRKVFAKEGPALLFENIKGYRDTRCTKLFTGGLGTMGRLALMLGMPKETRVSELVKITMQRMKRPIKPVIVGTGPVKENKLFGDDINLCDFPVPKWHYLDGGRYINTFCGVVTRDPDTGVHNVGMYAGMISGRDKIPSGLVLASGWGQHFSKHKDRGTPMPVAVAYGWDPVMGYCAAAPVPTGISEYDIMGGLRLGAVELVKCETCDIYVPATAEIVVEGWVSPDPDTYLMKGPFGEFTGYYGGVPKKAPVIKVECITHRNGPIYRGTLEGTMPGMLNENSIMCAVQRTASAWLTLQEQGVPGVLDVYVHPVTNGTNIVVQIHKSYRGQAKQVAMALWGSSGASTRYKNVMVVEEDIDIHSYEALDWAMAYRVNAGENDLLVMPATFGSVLDPSVDADKRDQFKYGSGIWHRLLIDATRNWEFEKQEKWGFERYPPLCIEAPEDTEMVDKRWEEYGID